MSLLIIGIGNKYRSDDAVGLEIADSLKDIVSSDCTVQTSAGEGIALINLWEDYDTVIMIDAVSSGSAPGTIHSIDLAENPLESQWFQTSSHLLALPEAIQLAKALKKLPENMIIYGVEGKNFEFGIEISEAVQAAKPLVIKKIKKKFRELNNKSAFSM